MRGSQHSDVFSYDDASQDLHVTLTPSQQDLSSTYMPCIDMGREKLIWGTTINVEQMADRFKEYVHAHCTERLENMHDTQTYIFELDGAAAELEPAMRANLEAYPQETLPILENAIREVYQEKFVEVPKRIFVRLYNIGQLLSIRSVNPADIDRVVQVTGLVIRVSSVVPEVHRALFRCAECAREMFVDSVKGVVAQPQICECGERLVFEIRHNSGEYLDTQIIKIQELPDNIPDATTPMAITVIAKHGLVDAVIPGDKVVVTGVLKAQPVRINPVLKKIKSTFRTFIEMLSVQPLSRPERVHDDYIVEVDELRRRTDVYELLSRSIAPSIFGMTDVKKGLLLQLFKGVAKNLGNTQLRGDINILLAGDPGISKSQLLSFIHRISERGMYTSGRGSSAVGLTASVSKDPDSGQFILESGALVLSDGGICCVDEFDKMNDSTRSVLHEAMEQQTVSLAKAGIITTLNARCSILASCNPVESKYNPKKTILENINIPPTLMSRFDLIFLLIDKSDEVYDKRVSEHILDLYTPGRGEVPDSQYGSAAQQSAADSDVVSIDVLKAYIREASKIAPQLTDESIGLLSEAYVDLRQLDNGETVTATTRQLESLVRLSEAHAKMRFSRHVEAADVAEAVRLIKESLLLYAVDPRTGKIDVNMIMTGRSASRVRLIEDLKRTIKQILKGKMSIGEIQEKTGADERLLHEAVAELDLEEAVYYNKASGLIEKIG
ncbi:DNA replication licensing factor MCM4 [Pancytospora philotis]|nr:DNA replication licensing factor MCM4 [Pancytospora philotis]